MQLGVLRVRKWNTVRAAMIGVLKKISYLGVDHGWQREGEWHRIGGGNSVIRYLWQLAHHNYANCKNQKILVYVRNSLG
jgi:hypothetical protein